MRTTITLEDDVAALLRETRRTESLSFKKLVNEALREGLTAMQQPKNKPRKTYRTPTVSLGGCLAGTIDDVAEVLAVAEGEDFR